VFICWADAATDKPAKDKVSNDFVQLKLIIEKICFIELMLNATVWPITLPQSWYSAKKRQYIDSEALKNKIII
jgi:hypothetical protein